MLQKLHLCLFVELEKVSGFAKHRVLLTRTEPCEFVQFWELFAWIEALWELLMWQFRVDLVGKNMLHVSQGCQSNEIKSKWFLKIKEI
jgi:hypothetical protein